MFKNEDVYAVIETQLGPGAKEELAYLEFQPFHVLKTILFVIDTSIC